MKKLAPLVIFLILVSLIISQTAIIPITAITAITATAQEDYSVINSIVQINTYNYIENDVNEWTGSGSGTIIDDTGLILTNYHVLLDEDGAVSEIIELCYTVSAFEPPVCIEQGLLLEFSEDMDLALVVPFARYDYETETLVELTDEDYFGYPAITIKTASASIDDLPVLQENISIFGYPGASLTGNIVVTEGIVTGYLTVPTREILEMGGFDFDQELHDQLLELFGENMTLGIETDAIINPGNSGGAAIDENDFFVGIPSLFSLSGEAGQYGYIIPTNVINIWLNQLVIQGKLAYNPSIYYFGNDGLDGETNLFFDVNNTHPNFDAIKYLKDNHIIDGYPDGTFLPEGEITRAELMKILTLARGIELDPAEYNNCFPDVKDDWYAKYVCYGKKQGWVQGYDDGTFRPGNNVVKAEAIKMVLETQLVVLDSAGTVKPYNDVELNMWYAPYVVTAKNLGILEEDGIKYYPGNNATRATVSENIYRIIK